MTTVQPWYRWHGADLELRVKARTQCREEGVAEATGGVLCVRVNAPPVEGRANKRLLAILADAFGVAKTRVRLVHGVRSRYKWIRIEAPERIPELLKPALGAASGLKKGGKPSKQ